MTESLANRMSMRQYFQLEHALVSRKTRLLMEAQRLALAPAEELAKKELLDQLGYLKVSAIENLRGMDHKQIGRIRGIKPVDAVQISTAIKLELEEMDAQKQNTSV